MYLEKAITEFSVARKAEGFAANTIRNNEQHLKLLLRHVSNVQVNTINASDIDRLFSISADHYAADTLNQVQATYALFFRWCRSRKIIPLDHDPIGYRRMRKVVRSEKPRLAATEFNKFLSCADNPRDRALCAAGLYLFLRQSEAVDLRIGDLNLDTGDLRVRIFKTADEDVMPVSLELEEELRTYLSWYSSVTPRPLTKSDYLFPARERSAFDRSSGGTISRYHLIPVPDAKISRVNDLVRRTFAAYGWDMDQRIGMHDLRRSGARALFDELVETGYDGALRTVQAYLHHASATMTERYLGVAIDRSNRNKKFRGKPMFASQLAEDNVVELRRADG